MQRELFILESLLIFFLFAVATCSIYSFSENSQKADNYLTLNLDKKIYNSGDEIKITIQNLSDENVYFPNSYFGLTLERWDGTAWVEYLGIGREAVISSINPHGEVVVVQRLTTVKWEENTSKEEGFRIGRYRAATGTGWLDEGSAIVQAYAEFDVVEASRWPLIVGVVGAIMVIGVAVAVYNIRRR